MDLSLEKFYKSEIMTNKDSDIMATLNSKLSLEQAKFANTVKRWKKL